MGVIIVEYMDGTEKLLIVEASSHPTLKDLGSSINLALDARFCGFRFPAKLGV